MATIKVTSKWDAEANEYVPDQYSIEGEGLIDISYNLMNKADPRYVRMEGNIIYFGPYQLEVIAQSRSITGEYSCKLLNV